MSRTVRRTRFIPWTYRLFTLLILLVPIALSCTAGILVLNKQAEDHALHFLAGSVRDIKNVARSKFDLIRSHEFNELQESEIRLSNTAKHLALTCRQVELLAARSRLSGETAKEFSLRLIESIDVAETGYAFVLHDDGMFLYHPKLPAGFEPEDVQYVREILRLRSGVVRYWWRNPEEPEPVERLTGFEPVPSWNWIIGVSVPLTDLVDTGFEHQNMEGVKEYIRNFQPGHSAFAFVLDGDGAVVAHPMYAEGNKETFAGMDAVMNRRRPFIRYRDEMGRRHFAFADTFEPWEWTIVVTAPKTSLFRYISRIQPYWIAGSVVLFLVSIAVMSALSRRLVARVVELRRPVIPKPAIYGSGGKPPESSP